MFTKAILRRPCPELVRGITTASLGVPDYANAVRQHEQYAEVLQSCGLQIRILDADNRFPDSVFIEDVALCTPHCAVITRPGALSRQGETAGMETVLRDYYAHIDYINAPGTLEAGDVMMVGEHYYIGLSARTNAAGAAQLIAILEKYGMSGSTVQLKTMLHLKTGVSYLEENHLLVYGEFVQEPAFKTFQCIEIDEDEAYTANSLWINGRVLVPEGFPKTAHKIETAGFEVIPVAVSEFQKLDGGLSCLSLRF